MKRKDLFLAIFVVIVWGANFTVIKIGLDGIPSMLLVSIRYAVAALPAVFFVKKPNIHWKYIIYYGLTVGVGQFACLFYAMEIGMPAGLASVIAQSQAFITPFLSAIILKEKIRRRQIIGFLIAAIGLTTIGFASTTSKISSIQLKTLFITLGAPVFWSFSNIIARYSSDKLAEKGEKLDMFSLVIWSSLIPPIPMFIVSLLINGRTTVIHSLVNINFNSVLAVIYVAYASTLFGYGLWGLLITKYPLAKISPLSLLVPITGLLTARLVLSEQLSQMQWIGSIIIILGLVVSNVDMEYILNKSKSKGA